MKIKIAHLYYDLMNLYGENGNVRALKKYFEQENVECEIHFLTINDIINFNDFDLYYIGMGSEKSQELVIEDLKKYKKEIKEAINNNKYFIMTGNAYEMFGKYIIDFNEKKIECLDIFPYYTKRIDKKDYMEDCDFRIVGSVSGKTKLIEEKHKRSGPNFLCPPALPQGADLYPGGLQGIYSSQLRPWRC